MRFNFKYLSALFVLPSVFGYIDQPCHIAGLGEGVCVKASNCAKYNGQTDKLIPFGIKRACLNDPKDVICCVKKAVVQKDGDKRIGRCRNVSHCPTSKNEIINAFKCPGSRRVKLCVPKVKTTITTTRTTIRTISITTIEEPSQSTTTEEPTETTSITTSEEPTETTSITTTEEPTETVFTQREIIDVSQWNSIYDYDAAAKAVDGVLMRCGFRGWGQSGKLVMDNSLEAHYNGFKGKTKIGYYFFTQATTVAEAEEEAVFIIDQLIKDRQNDFPIYWDSENSGAPADDVGRADNLSVADRTACAVAFVKKIKSLGYRAGVYASQNWFKENLDYNEIVNAGASIWVARYNTEKPTTADYDAWQFSSTETVDGITGNVDRSHVYRNIAGW